MTAQTEARPGVRWSGGRVRRIREHRGLNQLQLAARARLSVAKLDDIERGYADPPASTLAALAVALECGPGQLFEVTS